MTVREKIETVGGILVAHDGSAASQGALRAAAAQAEALHMDLTAVRIWSMTTAPRPSSWSTGFVPPLADFEAATLAALEHDVEAVRAEHPDLVIATTVARGRPAELLLEASEHVDLIVMGNRGRGGFAGLLLGSVSEQVVRHAHCSVLIDRGTAVTAEAPESPAVLEDALLSELGLG